MTTMVMMVHMHYTFEIESSHLLSLTKIISTTPGTMNMRSTFPNLHTPIDTISDLLKVEHVRSRCSGATCLFLDAAVTYRQDHSGDFGA